MVPAELYLTVTSLAAGGDGIARAPDGRVVFVEGGLPGEELRATTTDERKDYLRARIDTVELASDDRVAPPCPELARGCGGCTWQHVRPAAQSRLKAGIIADALRRLAHVEVAVDVGPAVSPESYRTTVHLAVDDGGRACFHRRQGHEVVPVDQCLVSHPLLEPLIVGARYRGAKQSTLRVGGGTGERLVWPRPHTSLVDVPDDVIVARRAGEYLHERVAGRRWRVSAGSFFQSGPDAAEVLVGAVVRSVGDALGGGHLVDAYCGVGLLGGALVGGLAGPAGGRLTAIESQRTAAADAAANLAQVDARVVCAEVSEAAAWPSEPVDVIVADPARPGLGRSATAAIAARGAPVVVLVSCDPASHARDATLLASHGYALARVEAVDLFPHTFHVEAVSRFELVGVARPPR